MITSTVVVRLDCDDVAADRRALADLTGLPSGSRVLLKVGTRAFPPISTVMLLAEATDRLMVDVRGSSRAASAWVSELSRASDRGCRR